MILYVAELLQQKIIILGVKGISYNAKIIPIRIFYKIGFYTSQGEWYHDWLVIEEE
jgi:hypothetical protein